MIEPATRPHELLGIGEVARVVGCSPSLLRLLEADGAIPAPDRLHGNGARVYRPEDVDVILAARTRRAPPGRHRVNAA